MLPKWHPTPLNLYNPQKQKTGNPLQIPVFLVEVQGFEPWAFWSRTKRATKLRYTSWSQ